MSAIEGSTSNFQHQLVQHLLSSGPASVTIIGGTGQVGQVLKTLSEDAPPVIHFETLTDCHAALDAAEEATLEGAAVALLQLDDNGTQLKEDELAVELGKAVRRFPARLVVSIESEEPADTAFFAFGFRKLHLADQRSVRLFEYCLSEYKQSPDWLNSQYWANPARFNADEDPDIYVEDGSEDDEED
ncbi:DUF6231 family protein [Granulosicoccus antarcticus]|uniref:Uncharacterized protein n=1 Tax=Granulosicoccus antarcticus IMCC3135 TaxID=1192854 RepID=A0A2Z2NZH3_9GAMM|nr:DUF6231 family protein [Granulosicoccus antarcticus]ASJ76679.1 hypothetical protein IMCC3135_33175 [Granulosicoccus antarcticus IMCC3135]